jgi:hypothetical protein
MESARHNCVATSGHALTACGTGHDSLPWPGEARGGGVHVPPVGAGREERAVAELLVEKGADGGCRSLTRCLMVLYWTAEDGYKAIVQLLSRAQGRRSVVAKAFY